MQKTERILGRQGSCFFWVFDFCFDQCIDAAVEEYFYGIDGISFGCEHPELFECFAGQFLAPLPVRNAQMAMPENAVRILVVCREEILLGEGFMEPHLIAVKQP